MKAGAMKAEEKIRAYAVRAGSAAGLQHKWLSSEPEARDKHRAAVIRLLTSLEVAARLAEGAPVSNAEAVVAIAVRVTNEFDELVGYQDAQRRQALEGLSTLLDHVKVRDLAGRVVRAVDIELGQRGWACPRDPLHGLQSGRYCRTCKARVDR